MVIAMNAILRAGFASSIRLCLLVGVTWQLASVSSAEDIVRIEEHWELTVGGPVPNRSAPQVTMTMSPTGDLECHYFVFTLNHATHPEYTAGGSQVQHWHNEEHVQSQSGPAGDVLFHDDETIRWTQRLTLQDGTITFEIADGSSETWGDFGGNGYLKQEVSSSLPNLNGYKPSISLTESGISYGGNRVSSLVLQKLVWFTADGERYELTAPIDLDTDLDPYED
jgi:hypothetical protein